MIVSLASANGPVGLDASGFEPLSAGRVIAGAMARRDLTVEEVARASDLAVVDLQAIIDGGASLERPMARKLQRVFPKTLHLLLNIERSYQFYLRFGVIRPTSPIRRVLIERRGRSMELAA